MRQAMSSDTAQRWMSLVSGIFVLAGSGIGYTFAVYSPPLKVACNYNQKEIGLLGTAKDIGENWGLFPGLLVDILHTDIIFLIGVFHGVLGYGTLWLVASKRIAPLPFPIMALVTGIASNASAWFNTAVLVIVLRNFPKRRGDAVGLLKGFLGLSGAIYMQTYTAFVAPNKSDYLLMVTILPALTVFLGMGFIRPVPPPTDHTLREEKGKFGFSYRLCAALASYLMCVILLQSQWVAVHRHVSIGLFAGMAFLLSLFFLVPLRTAVVSTRSSMNLSQTSGLPVSTNPRDVPATSAVDLASTSTGASTLTPGSAATFTWGKAPLSMLASSRSLSPSAMPAVQEGQPALFQPDDDEDEVDSISSSDLLSPTTRQPHASGSHLQRMTSGVLNSIGIGAVVRKGPRRGEDFTTLQAMVKADFWLLFFSVLCGCGSGLTAINNLAQMGQAQGYSNVRAFVALVSIWNFLGRLAGGKYSEKLVKQYFFPRPLFLLGAQLLMIVGHLLFAFAVPGSLYLGSVIVGVCYGAHWSVMPATVSELFGLKSFGMLYNVFAMAIPLGSFLFSSLLAGFIYDREAHSSSGLMSPASWLGQLPKFEEGTWLPTSLQPAGGKIGAGWAPDGALLSVRALLESEGLQQSGGGLLQGKGPKGTEAILMGASTVSNALGAHGTSAKIRKVLASGGSAVSTAAKYMLWTPLAPGGGFGDAVAGPSLLGPNPAPVPAPEPVPGGGGGHQHCFGAHCFKLTFLIMTLVCLVGVVLNAILVYRTRNVYKSLYDKNERERRPLLRSEDGGGH